MPEHDCETFDFPLADKDIDVTITQKISVKGGGTLQMAMQEAIDKARQDAEDAGKAALKDQTCKAPCECFIFVDVSLAPIAPKWVGKNKLEVRIKGYWKAGILCVRPAKKEKPEGKSEEKSGGKQEEKSKDKPKKKKKKSKDKSIGKAAEKSGKKLKEVAKVKAGKKAAKKAKPASRAKAKPQAKPKPDARPAGNPDSGRKTRHKWAQ